MNVQLDKANIAALFIANTGYALANAALPKNMQPTMADIKTGIGYCAQFNNVFAKAVEAEDGSIIWSNGNKKDIIGNYFDRLSDEADTAVALLHEGVTGEQLKTAAMAIYRERDKRAYATPEAPQEDTSMYVDDTLRRYVAQRFTFYAGLLIKMLRDHGYQASFNPRSELTEVDLFTARDAELKVYDGADNTDIDHSDVADTGDWEINSIINAVRHGYELGETELHEAVTIQTATQAWFDWVEALQAEDFVTAEVVRIKQQARDFLEAQQKASPLQGQRRRIA